MFLGRSVLEKHETEFFFCSFRREKKDTDAVAEAENGGGGAAEGSNVRHMHNSVGGTVLRSRTRVPFF